MSVDLVSGGRRTGTSCCDVACRRDAERIGDRGIPLLCPPVRPAGSQAGRYRFGDVLELVGYQPDITVVTAGQPATVITYWRPLRALRDGYGLAFFCAEDGAVVGEYTDPAATTAWYPSSEWLPGETVRLETPVLEISRRRNALSPGQTLGAIPISRPTGWPRS